MKRILFWIFAAVTLWLVTPDAFARPRHGRGGGHAGYYSYGGHGGGRAIDRLISIVLLLKAPHDLTHKEIAHAISEGTGKKISEADVVSKAAYHLVTVGSDKYIVNNVGEPYFADCDKLAAEIKEHKLGESVKESKAWLSVDWVGKADKTDIKPVYQMIDQMIGKMASHLAGKDTVAAYSPDMDEFALWTPEVIKGLESDDPLAVFDHDAHDDAEETADPAAVPKKTSSDR